MDSDGQAKPLVAFPREMNEGLAALAFVLLLFGTAGLLANEIILSRGTTATLVFAVLNASGLLALGVARWGGNRPHSR